ncbi:FHA domain-containing protein [Streptomyces sp. NPDC102365]|uniref:FHA domain-containing protein n=1 Tax=Streptomyces sp. NPDC102365 TaxID=3366162 RepID=UPI00381DA220
MERDGEALDASLSRVSVALPPGMAVMMVRRGPDAGARIVLEREVIGVGSDPDSDIYIDDPAVSSRHFEIHRNGENFIINVTCISNRIYLNGESVRSQEMRHGDEVQIGKVNLVFLVG